MLEVAKRKNPHGRHTTPTDVARIISLLCSEGGEWISGELFMPTAEKILSAMSGNAEI